MTSRAFTLPWSNPDLDIHPDPAEGWHRVAVVGLWQDAAVTRKAWPEAAVCGPLRTLRGIDLLVRGLLANPQIRVVVVAGRDLTPGEGVQHMLGKALRQRDPSNQYLGVALTAPEHAAGLRILRDIIDVWFYPDGVDFSQMGYDADRPGGAVILPPPVPEPSDDLPAGLPGQRVTGATLADVWPRLLAEVTRFGNIAPTQYGDTVELRNAVSVIEDPEGSLKDVRCAADGMEAHDVPEPHTIPHRVLGISWAALDAYYTGSFMATTPPEGMEYGYGSRLHGGAVWGPPKPCSVEPTPGTVECSHCGSWASFERKPGEPLGLSCANCGATSGPGINQIEAIGQLPADSPDTRAAYLTPWRPDEDSGKESGRPCMVGAWFRVTPQERLPPHPARAEWEGIGPHPTLHLTVTFRSHDLFGAYPLNLAACCRWLVETAEARGMTVGTVTCLSMSGHVYARDWDAARALVEKHDKPGAWAQDPRSAWRVWSASPEVEVFVGLSWSDGHDRFTVSKVAPDGQSCSVKSPFLEDRDMRMAEVIQYARGDAAPVYYAEASSPDGARVLILLASPHKARLLRDIQATGLVTTVDHALWLGAELGRLP